MNPQKFSLRESIVLYSILLGCFAVFCYMDWRYIDVQFLGLAKGDEMEHFLELQSIYNGFITLNIKKIFTIGAYNYGFPYYMLNLLAALPFIITENYSLQIYAPRVLNALFSIANLYLIYKIARMYLSARLCVVVIGIFIAMSGFWHQGYIYKPDVFQAFFVLACAYYLLCDNFSFGKHYTLAWIALGLGMGVAKFQAILFIPMVYAYIFMCMRTQCIIPSIKRAIVATFGIFAIWIATNPYLLHPRGFNAWYAMFEGNMNSNATNHGAYTQVSLSDKLAMIDYYYFEIVVFIALLAVVAYYCFIAGKQAFLATPPNFSTLSHAQGTALRFAPIAAGLGVSFVYLLFFVNKAWEAYYFSSIALAILVLSTLGTLRVSKLLGGGGAVLLAVLFVQIIGASMSGSYKQVFTKYYAQADSVDSMYALSDELVETLRPLIHDTRATILSENTNFAYLSLGLKPTQIYPIYGLSYPAGFVYEEWAKESRANSFIPKDFIILYAEKNRYDTPKNTYEQEAKDIYQKLINGSYPYKKVAKSAHFIIFANTDEQHSNILTQAPKE